MLKSKQASLLVEGISHQFIKLFDKGQEGTWSKREERQQKEEGMWGKEQSNGTEARHKSQEESGKKKG